MWLLFGNRTKARPVPGGRALDQSCRKCQAIRHFIECEIGDQVSVFFIPLVDLKSRRLVCTTCGDDVEIPVAGHADRSPTDPTSTPGAKGPSRPSEEELSRMLGALKRKMGL